MCCRFRVATCSEVFPLGFICGYWRQHEAEDCCSCLLQLWLERPGLAGEGPSLTMGAALSQPAFVPVQAPLPLSPAAASSQGASPAIDLGRAHTSQPSHALAAACLASAGSVSLRLTRAGRWKKPRGRVHQVLRLAAATDVPVDRERYTDAAWQAMQDGPQIAQRCQSQYVEPEHVFLACLEQQVSTTGGLCARILEKVGITQQVAKDRVMEPWNKVN